MSSSQMERVINEVSGLRAVADFLESRAGVIMALSYEAMTAKFSDLPHKEVPYVGRWVNADSVEFTVYGPNMRETMRTFRKSLNIPGEWEKGGYGNRFEISTRYNGIRIAIEGDRGEVCQRVVTGTSTVTIPAVEAQPERTEEREEVEWVCGNLLDD